MVMMFIPPAAGLFTGAYPELANSLDLIVLDAASFHRTPVVWKIPLASNVIPCMIAGGCIFV